MPFLGPRIPLEYPEKVGYALYEIYGVCYFGIRYVVNTYGLSGEETLLYVSEHSNPNILIMLIHTYS